MTDTALMKSCNGFATSGAVLAFSLLHEGWDADPGGELLQGGVILYDGDHLDEVCNLSKRALPSEQLLLDLLSHSAHPPLIKTRETANQ